jgi:glucose-6-phosphate 1-dehydrogenase
MPSTIVSTTPLDFWFAIHLFVSKGRSDVPRHYQTSERNPVEGPRLEPLIFAIFGASGDLAQRKLIPAVFDLFKRNYLPENFALLGISRSELSDDDFRDKSFFKNEFLDLSQEPEEIKSAFAKRLFYQPIDTNDQADYVKVKDRLEVLDKEFKTAGNCIFYLSTPPMLYEKIPAALGQHGLNRAEGSYRRLVIEKPFGYDLASAHQLNMSLKQHFDEDNIYRIDHYLGKETVQNLLVTRFANGIFEPLWNRNYIHHVEITSAEDFGVGSRGGYYDHSGALRDMLQNHLMQLVAHVAMEPPIRPDASAIRNEKNKLLESLRPITPRQVKKQAIRGQYTESKVRGVMVKGYRDEDGVPADSKTETFVALKFFIDNWRWSGVPFYIRTGKRLPTKVAEITITFNRPPHILFRREAELYEKANNQMIIRIQPDEGLLLNFGMKVPGEGFHAKNVSMDFHYSELADSDVPESYERLLLDCMKGDATLYAHGDSVERSWKFVEPILDGWKNDDDIPIYGYPAGSWGPEIADDLIRPAGMHWRNPCRRLTDDNSFCEL